MQGHREGNGDVAFKINGAPWRTWKLKQAPAANKICNHLQQETPALFVVVLISVPSDAHRRPRAVSLVLCAFLCLLHFSSLGLLLALLLVALHFLPREPEIRDSRFGDAITEACRCWRQCKANLCCAVFDRGRAALAFRLTFDSPCRAAFQRIHATKITVA